jgi:hypothetical protein
MRTTPLILMALATAAGCGTMRPALRADLPTLGLGRPAPPAEQDLFGREGSGSISEDDLQRALSGPVFLRDRARVGVVQVTGPYGVDGALPLTAVPAELTGALESSGLVEAATEVSADWPSDRGISGLRELAARYRSEYLLLYRHRFVDRSWTNAWGWLYATIVGTVVVPSQMLETDGVLEATLFDVRTGSLLFTVFERVHGLRSANLWYNERKLRELQTGLLKRAAARLAESVVGKARRLALRRPAPPAPVAAAASLGS